MRPNQNNRRPRGRNNSGGNNRRPNVPNRNQTFDSNGPDVRIRGTAFQVAEKYQNMARDAAAAGDRVLAENYMQHAEHYQRVINAMNESVQQQREQRQQPRIDEQEDGAGPGPEGGAPPPRRGRRDRDEAQAQPSTAGSEAIVNGKDEAIATFAHEVSEPEVEQPTEAPAQAQATEDGDLFSPPARPAPRRRGRRPQRQSGTEQPSDPAAAGEVASAGNGHDAPAIPTAASAEEEAPAPRPRRRRAPRKTDDDAPPPADV